MRISRSNRAAVLLVLALCASMPAVADAQKRPLKGAVARTATGKPIPLGQLPLWRRVRVPASGATTLGAATTRVNRVLLRSAKKLSDKALAGAGWGSAPKLDAAAYRKLGFRPTDLVYGLSRTVAQIEKMTGARTLVNDMRRGARYADLGTRYRNIRGVTAHALRDAAREGTQVRFDLTGMREPGRVARGNSIYSRGVSGYELRWIRRNWNTFTVKPKFYLNGREVPPPWL